MDRTLLQWMHPTIYLDGDDGGGGGSSDSGAGGSDDGGSGGGTADAGGGASGERGFSQADLNRAAGDARREGRESAEKKLADELGVPLAEAKDLIKKARDQEESEKSEAQKAIDKAKADSDAANERAAAAALREHRANIRDALRDEGVSKERLDAVTKLVDVEVGADDETIATAVAATKKDFPELFGGKSGGAPSSDTGGAPQGGGAGGEDALERGRKRAVQDTRVEQYPVLEAMQK